MQDLPVSFDLASKLGGCGRSKVDHVDAEQRPETILNVVFESENVPALDREIDIAAQQVVPARPRSEQHDAVHTPLAGESADLPIHVLDRHHRDPSHRPLL